MVFAVASETSLYPPIKDFLEGLGFVVKGEIGGCDLLALRHGEPPIVVVGELKTRFNLELVLQAVDRAPACDEVWIAARVSSRAAGRENDARFRNLCRRLGFGMLGVTDAGSVDIIVSPASPMPRRDPKRRSRLVEEHRPRDLRSIAPAAAQILRGNVYGGSCGSNGGDTASRQLGRPPYCDGRSLHRGRQRRTIHSDRHRDGPSSDRHR